MPSLVGVLEERERAALARAEELRVELERVQAAVAMHPLSSDHPDEANPHE